MTDLEKMLYDKFCFSDFCRSRNQLAWQHTDDYETDSVQQKFKQLMLEIKNEENKTIANLFSLVKNSENQQMALTKCIEKWSRKHKSSLSYNLVENRIDPASTTILFNFHSLLLFVFH